MLAFFAACLAPNMAVAEQATRPARVASFNLCTDQLALQLARPGQLVSVSWLAHQEHENPNWKLARTVAANRGTAEELLQLDADVYLAGPFTARKTLAILKRLGMRVIEVPPADTVPQIHAAIRATASALDRGAQGEVMILDIQERLQSVQRRLAGRVLPQRAAIYWPGGTVAGPKSLPGELLRVLGVGNVASAQGEFAWSALPLEDVIRLRPDWLVISEYDRAPSQRQRLMRHPAYASFATQAVTIPSSWWSCGTPQLAAAAERLAEALLQDADATTSSAARIRSQ
jgi:iron complex transport system substrate-binding protein